MTEELKPCPFCGGEAVDSTYNVCDCCGKAVNGSINCSLCNAKVDHYDTSTQAIQAWNARVQPTIPSVEEIDKVIRNHPSNEYFSKDCVLVDVEDTVKAIHNLLRGEK
jgi:hypothetical protein